MIVRRNVGQRRPSRVHRRMWTIAVHWRRPILLRTAIIWRSTKEKEKLVKQNYLKILGKNLLRIVLAHFYQTWVYNFSVM